MTTLLQTKLTIPAIRPSLVVRARLKERLNEIFDRKLVLVSAPAGFGKTTLIAAFAAQAAASENTTLAWLSLGEDDNDPTRFLVYLLKVFAENGLDLALDATALSSTSPVLLMTDVVNALTAVLPSQPQAHFILVFDDYHLIQNKAIHEVAIFLLDNMPSQMHLIIATRADPPLPLARWRVRGQLTEFRQQDLSFNSEEAVDFLNRVMGLNLSAEDVQRLNNRTEGWIAGLQMAAVSLQSQPDSADFVRAFSGSHRHVLDYLMEEVLSRLSAEMTQFLMQTAILDRLCAPLCDAILESREPSSQKILNQLEMANLFIIPLDQERYWYRYHRLFADLLRQRLVQSQPSLPPLLHQRAAAWFEANGYLEDAINEALLAGDADKAATLIERAAEPMLMRSELVTVTHWLSALPEAELAKRPSLIFYYAWALIMEARNQLEVEQMLQHVSSEGAPGELALVHGLLAILHGNGTKAVSLAQQALDQLAPDRIFFRGVATWILGLSLLFRGDLDKGIETLEAAVQMSQQVGNMTIAVASLGRLANQAWRDGDLFRAKRFYEQTIVLATDEAERPLPIAGESYIGLARIYFEWNELETALSHAETGLALLERWREVATIAGHLWLARIKQAQGDSQSANDILAHARQIAYRSKGTQFDDMAVAMTEASIRLLQGNEEAVAAWCAEQHLPQEIDLAALHQRDDLIEGHLRKYEFIIMARLRITQKRPDKALVLLQPLLVEAQRLRRLDLQLEIHILIALALQQKGDLEQADSHLREALILAEAGGFIRTLVEAGADIGTLLLRQNPVNEKQQTYLHNLLTACGYNLPKRQTEPFIQEPAPLVEPLSERELEVLALIAEGLSNQEIANELVLSLPTIKWHTSNIYGKLGVRNRTTAVAQARKLNILP